MASCAETGDLLDAVLRPGNVGTAAGGLDFILEQVDRCRKQLAQGGMVRFDAGFPDGVTLAGLEMRKVDHMARIRNSETLFLLYLLAYQLLPTGRTIMACAEPAKAGVSGGSASVHCGWPRGWSIRDAA